jgi:hypothetical protein
MPGFVDVTGMTYEDVRRMGHADDYDDVDYQPRVRRQPQALPQVGYAVSDVWAAACAAQRVNGGYFKEYVFEHHSDNLAEPPAIVKRKNRDVMMEFLQNPHQLTVEDVEEGERVRNWLQNDLTFRAVKGKLSEFDASTSKCLAVKDRFYTVSHRYELAVIACLPNSATKSQARQETDTRIKFAQGGHIGTIGAKITANVEVLSATYSQEYNIYWIRGITDADQPVTFSSKVPYDAGTHLSIQGKVKAHRDQNLTQLNYVKVL